MAGVEDNNKPKREKTSDSITSTLPRLCPKTKLLTKDINCNIPKPKKRFRETRPVSNESNRPGLAEHTKNLYKSKLTEFRKTQERYKNSIAVVTNYHGQIPILQRHSFNVLRMSPPVTRTPSPVKRASVRENKSSNKIKTITLDDDSKKKSKSGNRTQSPLKRSSGTYKKKETSKSPLKTEKSTTSKRSSDGKSRSNSPTKRKSTGKILSSSTIEFAAKEGHKASGFSEAVIIKQSSQPSLCKNEKIIHPQGKISLDNLKDKVYTGDHQRTFEKVHLCIEKSVENLTLGESKRSYLLTCSSEDIQEQNDFSFTFLQNVSRTSITSLKKDSEHSQPHKEDSCSKSAIRTLSGHELILTPSMKLGLEKAEPDDIEIAALLHETDDTFDDQRDVIPFQDDSNEYDSEMSTDGEIARVEEKRNVSATKVSSSEKTANALWKSREAELLNDVDYRQSVYHPTVSRRQKDEASDLDFAQRNKANVDDFGSWSPSFDKIDDTEAYNPVVQEVPLYCTLRAMKRVRTKKERISGALLRFTFKVIRLLALFDLWPGDNCYMLTSQSLRYAR